jgi:hypothetical protein
MANDDTPGTRSTAAAEPGPPLEHWSSPLPPSSNGSAFDPTVAHPARVYAYWLGGKDHFPADRKAAEEVMRLRPR